MVFKPQMEHDMGMGMSYKNGDDVKLPFLYNEESIRPERD